MVVSEERIAALEARTERLEAQMRRVDARLAGALDGEPRPAGALDGEPRRAGALDGKPRRAGALDGKPRRAGALRSGSAPGRGGLPPLRVEPTAPGGPPASRIQLAERGGSPASHAGSAGRQRRNESWRPVEALAGGRIEDLVGGRVLGWVGALAVLVGLLFFLVIAASRGWLGEEARALLGAAASLALLTAGAWLHERRGRNEAALAAAATGIAGLFATTVVAGPVYDLLPSPVALGCALLIGVAATALALRWEAPGIGWLGIAGALLSPALVGAAADGTGVALMLIAYAAGGAVMIWQRWHALAGVAFAIAAPQLAWWLIGGDVLIPDSPEPLAVIAALVVFGAVTAVSAAGFEWRIRARQVRVSALVLLALNALALAGLGSVALGETGTTLWLAALGLAHIAAGLLARRSTRVSRELPLAASALGVLMADVAFASVAGGLPLAVGWAAGAVGFSVLARAARHRVDEAVAIGGLAGHLLLAMATALTNAAESGSDVTAAVAAALAVVAAGAWAAARIVAPRRPRLRLALDAAALGAIALLSAYALDGVALTFALAGEATALAALARRDRARAKHRAMTGAAAPTDDRTATEGDTAGQGGDTPGEIGHTAGQGGDTPGQDGGVVRGRGVDPLPFPAAMAFLGLALAYTVAALAPPAVLVAGLDPVLPAAGALSAVVVAAVAGARAVADGSARLALGGLAACVGLYLVSALVVTPFQPGGDATGLPLEQLDIRQQGQALLSVLWALLGVAGLLAGLVRDNRGLRLAALALLALTAAKVFAFDLASLTSLYRVGSCVALGLLLLAGAFAWQRIRPRSLPDLREVPGALR